MNIHAAPAIFIFATLFWFVTLNQFIFAAMLRIVELWSLFEISVYAHTRWKTVHHLKRAMPALRLHMYMRSEPSVMTLGLSSRHSMMVPGYLVEVAHVADWQIRRLNCVPYREQSAGNYLMFSRLLALQRPMNIVNLLIGAAEPLLTPAELRM
jgi:hypothetical protein